MVMKILRKTMPILSAVLLLASCGKDAAQTEIDGPSFGDEKKEVIFNFSTAEMDYPQSFIPLNTAATRADEPAMETDLKNLRVLQFDGQDASAKLIFDEYYTSDQVVSDDSGKKLYVALYEKEKTCIYVIANTASDQLADLDENLTLGAFEAKPLDFSSENDVTLTGTALPMVGSFTGSTKSVSSIPVSLERVVAKIAFTCISKVEVPNESFEIKRIQLLDVASKVAFKAPDVPSAQTGLFPDGTSSDNFFDYAEKAVSGTTIEHTWYMPENLRGVVAGLTEKTKGGENVPAHSTCIEVSGDYTKNGVLEDVTYRIYPGANASTDFNLIRNNSYSIKATIIGKNENDIRVIVEKGIPAGKYDDGEWN